jgi:hydroxyacylglutathione hydrolase
VPSIITLELATNPLMRSETPAVQAAVSECTQTPHPTPVDVLATIHEWKNSF